MSEVTPAKESAEPTELEKLKAAHSYYGNALNLIAHSEFEGYKAHAIAKTLDYFLNIKMELEEKIKVLEPAPEAKPKLEAVPDVAPSNAPSDFAEALAN